MKKLWMCCVLFLLISSCSPREATEPPVFTTPVIEGADESDSLDDALVHRLSVNLGIDESEISILSSRETEFSDACMDIALPGVACAQVVTPGRIFILEANGLEYEYRTTANGDSIQPATLALTWRREGGIAGFCDGLTVYLSGEVYGTNCRSQPNETSGYFAKLITATEQKQFNSWFLKYGELNLDVSDPEGVSDRMINTLVFYGSGGGKPNKSEQQVLFDWAVALFQKLNS